MPDRERTRDAAGENPLFRAYGGLLFTGALVLGGIGWRTDAISLTLVVGWLGATILASLLSVPISPRHEVEASVGGSVMIAMAILLPPPATFLIVALGATHVRELRREATVWASMFNRGQSALSAGAVGVLVSWLGLPLLPTLIVAVVTFDLLNSAFVSVALLLLSRTGVTEAVTASTRPIPSFAIEFLMTGALAGIVVVGYAELGLLAFALVAPPLFLAYSALRSARTAEDRAVELAARVRELEVLHDAANHLLNVGTTDAATKIALEALQEGLATADVAVDLAGDRNDLGDGIELPGLEPGCVRVPVDSDDRARNLAESIAGLLGLTLVRIGLEEELAEVQRARARLAQQLIEESTHERSRLALELHDDALPSLAGAEMQADNTLTALQRGQVDRAETSTIKTRDAINTGISRLREVLTDLRKQVMVPGELPGALGELAREVPIRLGAAADVRVPDPYPEIPFAVEILVLETVRGALANAINHSQANRVDVVLTTSDATLRLEVRDDGVGFDPAAATEGRHGLALMRQRTDLARGSFVVDSTPGGGTTVTMEVPL